MGYTDGGADDSLDQPKRQKELAVASVEPIGRRLLRIRWP